MPIIIRCKNCGTIYYYGSKPVPIEIYIKTINICKKCGAPIVKSIDKVNIEVKIIE